MASTPPIQTNGLLYHFLQRELWEDDVWLYQSLASRLILRLGIWIAPEAYARLPWLVPYARRDPASRGNKRLDIPDQWGSPDEFGYVRDDNSLLKGVPRSMPVRSTLSAYRGRRLGNGFVAAHVWRTIDDALLAARHPLTYSFVPNVVWLPTDVAKLTDREGSFAQQFVQALAEKIFRASAVAPALRNLVDEAWALLPSAAAVPAQALPDVSTLNYFVPQPRFFDRRAGLFTDVARALRSPDATAKVVASRYAPGLAAVDLQARRALSSRLDQLADVLRS